MPSSRREERAALNRRLAAPDAAAEDPQAAASARTGAVEAKAAPLDVAAKSEQQSRSGRVVEDDDDPVERVARKTGWRPQTEWTRDPTKWVDAETWLERQQAEIRRLQDEKRQAERLLAQQTEGQRSAVRAEAEREVTEAVETGDKDKALAASRKLAAVQGPPPEVAAWMAENPWFKTSTEARALAQAVSLRVKTAGGSVAEELESARAEVARRFPELFNDVSRPIDDRDSRDAQYGREGRVDSREEQSLADLARSAPNVAGGSRNGGGRPTGRAKGFAQLPADTKAAFEKNFRHRGVDPEKYAARYWADQG